MENDYLKIDNLTKEIKELQILLNQKINELNYLNQSNELFQKNKGLELYFTYYQDKPDKIDDIVKILNYHSYSGFVIFCLNNLEKIKNLHFRLETTESEEEIDNSLSIIYLSGILEPHYEFIIRNNMIKFPNVKHILYCGDNNYEFYKKLNISKLIIINKHLSSNNDIEFSTLLTLSKFWEELSTEYVLICHSDSIIFNDNIKQFYGYDFIGAPWLKPKNNKQLFQGNGHFSLRKRLKMIDIINNTNIMDMPIHLKPLRNMKNPRDICPEDVYFAQYLHKDNTTKHPDFELACKFSVESFTSHEPFGGSNFFNQNWIKYLDSENYFIKNFTNINANYVNDDDIEHLNLNGKIFISKSPKQNELIIYQDNVYVKNKFLNSDCTKNYIKSLEKSNINITKKNIVNFNKVLIYKKRFDHNWRHFLIETFFDLACAINDNEIMVLISKNSPKHIYEIFTILNFKNYYEIDDNVTVITNELILNPIINDTLKQSFLQELLTQSIKLYQMTDKPIYQKVFLTRNNSNLNYRYVSNQEELNQLLKDKEYYFFEGGTVPLYEQLAIIHQAKIIITQIGANCDNVIFCNKKSKFKIIYPFNCKKWARLYKEYPQTELLYCGNNYENNGDSDKYNWNYTIDFSSFKI